MMEPISTISLIQLLFAENKKSYRNWETPLFIITFAIWLTKLLGIDLLAKMLGDLEVDNSKLKKALDIDKMPIKVEEGLAMLAWSFK